MLEYVLGTHDSGDEASALDTTPAERIALRLRASCGDAVDVLGPPLPDLAAEEREAAPDRQRRS